MRTAADNATAARQLAIDELLERYICWREACHAVRHAYQRWADIDGRARGPAHAEYLAALDREEHAARIYAVHINRLEHSNAV